MMISVLRHAVKVVIVILSTCAFMYLAYSRVLQFADRTIVNEVKFKSKGMKFPTIFLCPQWRENDVEDDYFTMCKKYATTSCNLTSDEDEEDVDLIRRKLRAGNVAIKDEFLNMYEAVKPSAQYVKDGYRFRVPLKVTTIIMLFAANPRICYKIKAPKLRERYQVNVSIPNDIIHGRPRSHTEVFVRNGDHEISSTNEFEDENTVEVTEDDVKDFEVTISKYHQLSRAGKECSDDPKYNLTDCVLQHCCGLKTNGCRHELQSCPGLDPCEDSSYYNRDNCAWQWFPEGCWQSCQQWRFKLNSLPFDPKRWILNGNSILSLRFRQFEYEERKDTWNDNVIRLISDLGGAAGICIGFSIISAYNSIATLVASCFADRNRLEDRLDSCNLNQRKINREIRRLDVRLNRLMSGILVQSREARHRVRISALPPPPPPKLNGNQFVH